MINLTSKMYVDNGLSEKQDNVISTTDLTCNNITVTKTEPTEYDELTSKMYVEKRFFSEKQDKLISTTDLTCNNITVTKTEPTENDALIGKMYVDNGLSENKIILYQLPI